MELEVVRQAFTEFHREFFELLMSHAGRPAKLRHLCGTIKAKGDLVKRKYREKPERKDVRKIVNGLVARTRCMAQSISENKRVDTKRLAEEYFRGVPIFENNGCSFFVVQDSLDSMRVCFLASPSADLSQDDIVDAARAGLMAEKVHGKNCNRMVVFHGKELSHIDIDEMLREKALVTISQRDEQRTHENSVADRICGSIYRREDSDIDKTSENQIESVGLPSPAPEMEQESEDLQPDGHECIGWIVLNRKSPLVLSLRRDEVAGYLEREYADQVRKDDYLVIENGESTGPQVYCLVTATRTFNISAKALTKSVDEAVHAVTLKPLFEISDEYSGEVRPQDLDGYKLRFPNDDELAMILRLPRAGLPLGLADRRQASNIVFFYPTSSEDILYQSMIVTGVQHSGKTNFLKMFVRALSSSTGLPTKKKPAIVILDGENEYHRHLKKGELPPFPRSFLTEHMIDDLEVRVLRISETNPDVTLSLSGIEPEHISYLVPDLPTKSAEIIEEIVRRCVSGLVSSDINLDRVRPRVIEEVRSNQLIHRSQKGAIIRALQWSKNLRLIDQPGCRPLTASELLVPGRVTIIDVFDLKEDDQKRSVALYLLLLMDNHKMNAANVDPGLLLILDEAHRLFPKKVLRVSREYIERVVAKIDQIVHRGRKRHYGVFLATQSPSDVYPTVTALCNTKVVFRLSGAGAWVRANLGKEWTSEATDLPTGTCVIDLRGTGLRIPAIKVKTVNVSDKKETNTQSETREP